MRHHCLSSYLQVFLVVAGVSVAACSTKTEECARLNAVVRSRMTELSAAQAALMSVDQTVVAFGADKGYGILAVVTEDLGSRPFESTDVQPVAVRIKTTLTDLHNVFSGIRDDLKSRDAARKEAGEAAQRHAASVGMLRSTCQNEKKAASECAAVSARLKQFPRDTAAEPDVFFQQLAALKKISITSEALVPVIASHIAILDSLGPKLIEIQAADRRIVQNQRRSAAVFSNLENQMAELAGICGND